MNKHFISSIEKFSAANPGVRYAVAVSGGADSMALLYWMHGLGLSIEALTVDHGLRAESAREAKAVAEICQDLGVKHTILKWDGEKPEFGIEAAAREARYGLMSDYCVKNGIGVIVTAHHADDQIETFLMNLGRGSGVYGLAGMKEVAFLSPPHRPQAGGAPPHGGGMRLPILRPLLKVRRGELVKYCDDNGIQYFNDVMNDDEGFLRVKIRKNRHLLGLSDSRVLLAIENLDRVRDFIEGEVGRVLDSTGHTTSSPRRRPGSTAAQQEECRASRVHNNTLDPGLRRGDGSGISAAEHYPLEFDESILLNAPDEVRFRVLSRLLSRDYPLRLADIKRAFWRLDAGDCKFTLAGWNIRRLNGKIRIWKEGEKWPRQ